MSNFIIIRGSPDLVENQDFSSVPLSDDSEISRRAAVEYFGQWKDERLWTIKHSSGESFDRMLTAAKESFYKTGMYDDVLSKFLREILSKVRTILIWYGDEYADLDTASDDKEFIKLYTEGLMSSSSEIYLKYDRD